MIAIALSIGILVAIVFLYLVVKALYNIAIAINNIALTLQTIDEDISKLRTSVTYASHSVQDVRIVGGIDLTIEKGEEDEPQEIDAKNIAYKI